MAGKFRLFVLLFLVAVIGVVLWFFSHGVLRKGRIHNIVLISIDTCRADYLSCYGCPGKITPNIDAVSEEGILFENVISPVPLTLPAHSTMLTGTIPPYHGIHDNLDYQLSLSNLTLAEILKNRGFTTGAVVSAFVLDSQFGLDQGFDYYNDEFEIEYMAVNISERKGDEASRVAVNWLQDNKDERFFLFLHYYDPHLPYNPPEPFRPELFSDTPSLYRGEIAYTDHCIGQVINNLKRLGLYDSTLLIIVGDHGEMLGEHKEPCHSYFIYQSAIKIPLIFKLPNESKSKRVNGLVGLVDIVPTVCGLLGIEPPDVQHGRDLSGYFGKKKLSDKERYVYCESLTPTKYKANSLLGAVTNRFKYIQTTRPELYDLLEDPRELKNLAEQEPQRARIMQDRLKKILEDTVRKGSSDSKLDLDEQGRAKLESLGYIAGSNVSENFEFDQTKDDPKDLIEFHNSMGKITNLISEKKYNEARCLCEELLEQRPDSFGIYIDMGKIALEKGNFGEAVVHLQKALKIDSSQHKVHDYLAMAYTCLEELEEAAKHFELSLEMRPGRAKIHNNLGFVLYKQGKLDEAFTHFTKAITIDPELPEVYHNFGLISAKRGKNGEAVEYYLKSLDLKPDQPNVHNELGGALKKTNRFDDALMHYKKSLKLDPNQPKVHNALGRLLTEQKQFDEAISHYTKSLKLNSEQGVVQNYIAEIYFQQGKNEQALIYWSKAMEIRPDMISALNNTAWLLAAYEQEPFYNPKEAVRLAKRAVELTEHKESGLLDTLSVAYAAAGRFDEAIETAQKAIDLTNSSEQSNLADEIKKHLELYQAGKPYRQEP